MYILGNSTAGHNQRNEVYHLDFYFESLEYRHLCHSSSVLTFMQKQIHISAHTCTCMRACTHTHTHTHTHTDNNARDTGEEE